MGRIILVSPKYRQLYRGTTFGQGCREMWKRTSDPAIHVLVTNRRHRHRPDYYTRSPFQRTDSLKLPWTSSARSQDLMDLTASSSSPIDSQITSESNPPMPLPQRLKSPTCSTGRGTANSVCHRQSHLTEINCS